jgi:hypothetical protein
MGGPVFLVLGKTQGDRLDLAVVTGPVPGPPVLASSLKIRRA